MNRFINWIVNHRKWSLLGAGVLGIGLAIIAYMAAGYLCNKILQSSITLLFLGLPTFFALWVFRTHDVQEQLKKAEEQLKRTEESTNNNTFFECARLLASQSPLSKKIALIQLAYLRRETNFDKEKIDSITKNISLNGQDLSFAQLCGINLSGVDLQATPLDNADLRGVDLSNAILNKDNFNNAKYDDETNFRGTIFEDTDTLHNSGMIYQPDEEDHEN